MTLSPNLHAFLALLRWCEGTAEERDPYRVCYGKKHWIADLSDHPAITGEWSGERLPEGYCRKASLKPGCRSTAAGAYQIIKGTWLGLRKASPKLLPDFGPTSQDTAACLILKGCRALEPIETGKLLRAVARASTQWASLPGAGRGQPERRLGEIIVQFSKFGGVADD